MTGSSRRSVLGQGTYGGSVGPSGHSCWIDYSSPTWNFPLKRCQSTSTIGKYTRSRFESRSPFLFFCFSQQVAANISVGKNDLLHRYIDWISFRQFPRVPEWGLMVNSIGVIQWGLTPYRKILFGREKSPTPYYNLEQNQAYSNPWDDQVKFTTALSFQILNYILTDEVVRLKSRKYGINCYHISELFTLLTKENSLLEYLPDWESATFIEGIRQHVWLVRPVFARFKFAALFANFPRPVTAPAIRRLLKSRCSLGQERLHQFWRGALIAPLQILV